MPVALLETTDAVLETSSAGDRPRTREGLLVALARHPLADLRNAVFTPTKVRRTDFRGAHFNSRAELRTSLEKAVFDGADLTGADFSGANLSGANLSGAIGVTEEQLNKEAASLTNATMPNGQRYEDWLKSSEEDRQGG